ncbi:alpha/beta fold hydrolase [Bradyrhizobium sp.]|jgi:pimeloyl-ACP methyl ester carboxylesterase|uniref:alpha/beta fold hydrolase n=1 Tax=Bradyrhizobium sp. TaxID=376 RepID=UPI003D120881
MPYVQALDGTQLYYEEVGTGSAVVFVHEFAGDYRTWEPQLRHFARSHRCITFSQRGYPPSDVPEDPARYSQDIARDDITALLDGLAIEKAHIVGHSMGGYTALHFGIHAPQRCISVVAAGCGWGSLPDAERSAAMKLQAAETGKMFAEEGIKSAAAKYADAPMRQAHKNKDPRGWSEFARMLGEHSALGHSLTMFGVQLKRPTLGEMEADLRRFKPPLLVIVGDDDEPCLEGSFFLKRVAPTAALLVLPRTGHNVTSEEPAAFNAALAELFFAAESGRWLAHKKAT